VLRCTLFLHTEWKASVNIRRLAAGLLAGASSVIGILAILMLLLFSGGIAELLRNLALPSHANTSFGQAFGQAIGNSLAALPGYVWSARWAIVALAVLGLVLGAVDAQRWRITRPWHDDLGFVATLGVVGGIVIGLLFASRATVQQWIADQPALFTQQGLLLASNALLLVAGVLLALGFGYVIWAAWLWWFELWRRLLRVPPAANPRPVAGAAARAPVDIYDWRTYQARQARLRRGTDAEEPPAGDTPATQPEPRAWGPWINAGLGAAVVIAFLLMAAYNAVGPGLLSGEVWVTRDTPHVAVPISFVQTPRQITASNTAGAGTVDIMVTDASGTRLVRPAVHLALSSDPTQFTTSSLDLRGLAPGDYRLDLLLRGGTGGLLRYVALYGGGLTGQAIAGAIGLVAGLGVMLATILVLELTVKRKVVEGIA
jgi:hypothetical protein